MPLTPDELKDRFLREIDRRGQTDRFIDADEERELLQIALAYGFDAARGRGLLTEACHARGYKTEREVRDRLRDRLTELTTGGHKLTRAEYEWLVAEAAKAVAGCARTDQDIRRLVLTAIEDTAGVRVRAGWFRDWFTSQKRRVGLA
jgi:hypothetical protein